MEFVNFHARQIGAASLVTQHIIPMFISDKTVDEARATLKERGWFHMQSATEDLFLSLTASLGSVVYETDVSVRKESRGLVTSDKALDFHTDHSLVDFVAWLCITPDARGGDTILADARDAFALLDDEDKKTLESVMLKEHAVFENDPGAAPLVSRANGELKFYYSFWLADKRMPPDCRRAFDAFRCAVSRVPFQRFKLRRNDVLVVDNSRILHGRMPIKDPSRRLKRLWIRSAPLHSTNEVSS